MDSESSAFEPSATPSPTDQDLVYALREGRVDALKAIYSRYARPVYGLAFKILGHAEEAEDITQEVFLTLWHRDSYNPRRGSLNQFLMMLTRSRAIDRLRSRGSRARTLQQWRTLVTTVSPPVNPWEDVFSDERSERVRNALAGLSSTERQILEIAYYEGLSQSEIASRLNIPLGTVKTRSRQGLLKLRQLLQDSL